jgi:diketogulonate reductase-like aldo/keto reductase
MKLPSIKLNNGKTIPQIGLGLWQVTDTKDFEQAFTAAIENGYRHFDSAQAYGNEQMLGAAIEKSDVPRKDFFITTKIHVNNITTGRTATSFTKSLENLRTDYVDLLLLHFPVSVARKRAWKVLEQIYAAGQAKSIGVSNYTVRHLEGLKKYADVTPAVNQVELHVFLQQPELLDYCRANNIVVEAYSPLAHAKALHEPFLNELAKKYNKTPAQIMLHWLVQQDLVILPKSVTPARIKQNIEVFDFEIEPDDMEKLKTLESNLRTCWDPTLVP